MHLNLKCLRIFGVNTKNSELFAVKHLTIFYYKNSIKTYQ